MNAYILEEDLVHKWSGFNYINMDIITYIHDNITTFSKQS